VPIPEGTEGLETEEDTVQEITHLFSGGRYGEMIHSKHVIDSSVGEIHEDEIDHDKEQEAQRSYHEHILVEILEELYVTFLLYIETAVLIDVWLRAYISITAESSAIGSFISFWLLHLCRLRSHSRMKREMNSLA